jgi:tellurite resistance protein TerC
VQRVDLLLARFAAAAPPGAEESIGTPALWIGFTLFVLAMLALDLGVFHRKAHEVRMREALAWTGVWIALALAFCVGVHLKFGGERALQFLTGYLIEKALSVDNLFVFLVIFSFFSVPAALQHRVLFWGIIGALVLRAMFIVAGAALLERFHWVMYVFGAFLVFTGFKILLQREEEVHPERNPVLKLFTRLVPSVPDYRDHHFIVREGGRLLATPLLMVLVVVEATDVVFAVDSIPAIFAISTDPFIVYTSNVFAILGLRALYFAIAGALDKVAYLKVGLGLVLAFVGAKMLLSGVWDMPILLSLGVIVAILAGAIGLSFLLPPARPPLPHHPPHPPDEQGGAPAQGAGASGGGARSGGASSRR